MLAARHFEAPLDKLIGLDAKVRQLQSEKELLQAERNKASRGGPPSDDVKRRMREVGERIKQIDAELVPLTAERDDLALWIPNARASYEHAATTPRRAEPPTSTGLPRSAGSSRCSTAA